MFSAGISCGRGTIAALVLEQGCPNYQLTSDVFRKGKAFSVG